ncbi:1-aminocyclopropane-1-carboxylate synthase [Bienertia sinuspersici]
MESSNGVFNNEQLLSTIATNNGHGEDVEYFDGWKAYDNDPYHPSNNPNGVIQMGLAENQLSFDLIKEWMVKNPQASICTHEGVNKFTDIAIFQDYHGLPKFRSAVAKFMGKARGDRVSFDPERIVMSGGATGANETLMFCLADPGEAFLVPSPYYPAFNRDLGWRTGVKLIPITCESWNKITEEALKSAYEDAQNKKIRVKGLIITNPSNPLGTVQDFDTLKMLVNFVNDKRIHLVCDEIFAATVFNSPRLISVAEVIKDMPHVNYDLFHIIYSLSKDLGMPGFRVGVVYSYNDRVVTTARKMSSFGLVSSQTQYMLASLLSDDVFVTSYLDKSRERLSQRHKHLTRELAKVGIQCLKSNAGLFVWMDLRHLLKKPTKEEELKLWKVIINDVKINVSPGSSFHCNEAGWFRVCFANMDDETVDVSLQRIRTFVRRENKESNNNNDNTQKPNLKKRKEMMKLSRLSFNSRRFEETPNLLSPHSPIPQSPLVKART